MSRELGRATAAEIAFRVPSSNHQKTVSGAERQGLAKYVVSGNRNNGAPRARSKYWATRFPARTSSQDFQAGRPNSLILRYLGGHDSRHDI